MGKKKWLFQNCVQYFKRYFIKVITENKNTDKITFGVIVLFETVSQTKQNVYLPYLQNKLQAAVEIRFPCHCFYLASKSTCFCRTLWRHSSLFVCFSALDVFKWWMLTLNLSLFGFRVAQRIENSTTGHFSCGSRLVDLRGNVENKIFQSSPADLLAPLIPNSFAAVVVRYYNSFN